LLRDFNSSGGWLTFLYKYERVISSTPQHFYKLSSNHHFKGERESELESGWHTIKLTRKEGLPDNGRTWKFKPLTAISTSTGVRAHKNAQFISNPLLLTHFQIILSKKNRLLVQDFKWVFREL
jgi:hypothetical protein